MVFVNSPWDNCNIRWTVHSGLPVSVCWVSGAWYSGTRMQKCRVKAPRLSQTFNIFLCAHLAPSLILKLFYARIWKAGVKDQAKTQCEGKRASRKMPWAKLPNAQKSQQHLRTRASMCPRHALYMWSRAP